MSSSLVKVYGSGHGTGFFAAPQYIVTCRHLVEDYEAGETVEFRFDNEEEKYEAEIVAVLEEGSDDLALLKSPIEVKEHYFLDRIAVQGRKAELTGYPHDVESYETAHIILGNLNGNGDQLKLEKANDVTKGYSGGPICSESDKNSVVGVCSEFNNTDEDDREQNIAYGVPASKVLDAWGDYVCEKRFTPQGRDRHPHNDFVYQALKTDFIGRSAEMERLKSFMEHDNYRPLLWQAVVAQGGSGKSRLAYELAHSLDSTWHCQLVRQNELTVSNLNKIYEEAARNLLLIADYAYTDTNELGEWVSSILQTSPKHDIRILMLQRQGSTEYDKAKWLESLEEADGNVDDFMYSDELPVTPLSEEDIHSVMKSYAENKGAADKLDREACHTLYETLKRVDPELLRPLFAIFIADAYIENPDESLSWNRDDALKHFCERELNIIKNIGLDGKLKKAAHLLTLLATITGGYSFEDGELPDLREFKKIKDEIGDELEEVGLAARNKDTYTVEAITPDLLGEYFVKMYLETHRDDIPEILEAARKGNGLATSDFLTRLFADHEVDSDFVEKCCYNKANSFFASWGLTFKSDIDTLSYMYTRNKGSADESLWCIQYVKGLYNYLFQQNDVEKVNEILETLKKLHETAKKSEITEVYARGLVNYLRFPIDEEKANEILERLKNLYETTEVSEIKIWYAQGIVNCIYKNIVDLEKAKETLRKLHEMEENHEITIQYAYGLLNYFINQTSAEKAKEILETLRELHETAKTSEITVEYAKVLFYYMYDFADLKEANEILERLKNLHETMVKSDTYILRYVDLIEKLSILEPTAVLTSNALSNLQLFISLFTNGVVQMAYLFDSVNQISNCYRCYFDIMDKIIDKTGIEDAKGNIHGIIIDDTNVSSSFDFTKYLESFRSLVENRNEIVNQINELNYIIDKLEYFREQCKISGSIPAQDFCDFFNNRITRFIPKFIQTSKIMTDIYNLFAEKDYEANKALEKSRKQLHRMSKTAEVTVLYAKGLLNHFCDLTDAEEAKNVLETLGQLYEDNKENAEVTVLYAKGIAVYILNFVNSKEEAAEYLTVADSLKKLFPENEEIGEICDLAQDIANEKFGL